jgi:hypothetical protein
VTVQLVPKPKTSDEVRESVVSILRTSLAEAEAGDVDTVILIMSRPDGEWITRQSMTMKLSESIGRMFIAMHEWSQILLDSEKQ